MISVIGAGKVGSTVAFLCAMSGLDDIVLINRDEKKAKGEVLDISASIPANSRISISGTSDCSKICGSDIVVVAASAGVHLQKRTEMLKEHADMIGQFAEQISDHAPDAKVLMVTNPVDVLTHVIQKKAGLPRQHVLGVASNLDSSRFRYLLARELKTSQAEITDAIVMGEHDDSMVPIFSAARCKSRNVTELLTLEQRQKITTDLRNYWKLLRDSKGSSVYGIASNTFEIIKAIARGEALDTVASVLLDGQYGLSDVCLGVPITVGKGGLTQVREISLDTHERELLAKSSEIVKKNLRALARHTG